MQTNMEKEARLIGKEMSRWKRKLNGVIKRKKERNNESKVRIQRQKTKKKQITEGK